MPSANTVNAAQSLQHRLIRAIKADPKKTGVLTVLVVMLAVLWVRMWSKSGSGASPAVANMTAAPSAIDASHPSHKQGEIQAALSEWRGAEIPLGLGRNLFAAKLEYFPGDGTASTAAVGPVAPVTVASGFWDQIEKSMSDQADQRREQRVLMENLQSQVSALRLETTMMGARPKAVIDGELVGVGDFVASASGNARTGFRVVKIEARRVIVEREGIKLEIPMK